MKDQEKVVHSYDMEDLADSVAFCRCWRSKKVENLCCQKIIKLINYGIYFEKDTQASNFALEGGNHGENVKFVMYLYFAKGTTAKAQGTMATAVGDVGLFQGLDTPLPDANNQ